MANVVIDHDNLSVGPTSDDPLQDQRDLSFINLFGQLPWDPTD